MASPKWNQLHARQQSLLGRIAAFQAYKRSHGECDEKALRQHQQEATRISNEMDAESRAWEKAHPNPRRSVTRNRTVPAAASAPAPAPSAPAPVRRMTRPEFLDRASGILTEDTSRLSYGTARDLALMDIEKRDLSPAAADRLDALVRNRDQLLDGKLAARWILITGSPGYFQAWRSLMTDVVPAFGPPAVAALTDSRDFQASLAHRSRQDAAARFAAGELRAMSETDADGGYAVPYFLDPTIIPTSGLATSQILSLAKVVTTTTNARRGVTAGSTGFTTKAEGAAADEDDPTFAAPGADTIPIWLGSDWLPFSVEFGMDQPDWATHAAAMFADSYAEFVSNRAAVGSGSSDPTGVFTRMAGTTTSPAHVTVTTSGTLGAVDLRAAWSALPERYRVDPSCAWVMSPSVEDRVSALSAPSETAGLGPQDFTVDPNSGQRRLFGRPILSVSDAPALTSTTGNANYCVVGSMKRFVIANRLGGFQVELVPNVPDFSNGGRPSGNRGFLATARIGCDVVNTDAFRLLSNS